MATFAVMNGNIVSNIIVADDKSTAEVVTGAICVEYTVDNPAGIGSSYDPVTGKFVSPTVERPTGV